MLWVIVTTQIHHLIGYLLYKVINALVLSPRQEEHFISCIMPLFLCSPPLHRSFHIHIHTMSLCYQQSQRCKNRKMKRPKNPFRSTLSRRIHKMLSRVDRNRQSRLKPTVKQQCRGILVFALVVVLIVYLVVLFVQNLVHFPQILFNELSGLYVFLAPFVHDHLSRFSSNDFVFFIPVRHFSMFLLLYVSFLWVAGSLSCATLTTMVF